MTAGMPRQRELAETVSYFADDWSQNAPPEFQRVVNDNLPHRPRHRGPKVDIYQPAPNPLQGGRANASRWILEFMSEDPLSIDVLTGWTGSQDPRRQVQLSFPSKEQAVAFARRQGWRFRIREPQRRRVLPKRYRDNFTRPVPLDVIDT
jgi:hypothetical protein